MNKGEKPAALSSIRNIFLSKAKFLADSHVNKYIEENQKELENVEFPMDSSEIPRIILKKLPSIMEDFCYDVDVFLSTCQISKYLNEIFLRLTEFIEDNLKKNKNYYEEYIKQDFLSINQDIINSNTYEMTILNQQINNINSSLQNTQANEELKKVINYKEFMPELIKTFSNSCSKLEIIPNLNEEHKTLVTNFKFFIEKNLLPFIDNCYQKAISDFLNDSILKEEHNKIVKKLKEELNEEKKSVSGLTEEIKNCQEKLNTIQQEKDKLNKEIINNSNRFNHDIYLEKEKIFQKESQFNRNLREKDEKIIQLESNIIKLNSEMADMLKNSSSKISELNKEIAKLSINNINESSNLSMNRGNFNNQIFSAFKQVKEVFSDFKETLDKMDKDKDQQIKFKNIEQMVKDSELKYNKWKEDVKDIKNEFNNSIDKAYELKLINLNERLNEMSYKFSKMEFSLNEELEKNILLKIQTEETIKENSSLKQLLKDKDTLIELMKLTETNNTATISKQEEINEALEMNLNFIKTEHLMSKDEMENLCFIIDDIIVSLLLKKNKNQQKYKSHLNLISKETKVVVENIVKKYKIF